MAVKIAMRFAYIESLKQLRWNTYLFNCDAIFVSMEMKQTWCVLFRFDRSEAAVCTAM